MAPTFLDDLIYQNDTRHQVRIEFQELRIDIVSRIRALDLRSIQLLPGGEPRANFSKRVRASTRAGGVSRDPLGMSGTGSAKYIHCVGEASPDRDDDDAGGGVVIEWARRAVVESEVRGCADVQEVLVKCRVGQFPSQKSFYLLVSRVERPCERRHVLGLIGDVCRKVRRLRVTQPGGRGRQT